MLYLQGLIQDFLIGGPNLQRGVGFDLLILPDNLLFFLGFPENYPWKWNNFALKGCSLEPSKPPLNPPLTCFCCRDLDQHRMMTITNHLQRGGGGWFVNFTWLFINFLKIIFENEIFLPLRGARGRGSKEPRKPSRDLSLTCLCCRDLDQHRMLTITNHLQAQVTLVPDSPQWRD